MVMSEVACYVLHVRSVAANNIRVGTILAYREVAPGPAPRMFFLQLIYVKEEAIGFAVVGYVVRIVAGKERYRNIFHTLLGVFRLGFVDGRGIRQRDRKADSRFGANHLERKEVALGCEDQVSLAGLKRLELSGRIFHLKPDLALQHQPI